MTLLWWLYSYVHPTLVSYITNKYLKLSELVLLPKNIMTITNGWLTSLPWRSRLASSFDCSVTQALYSQMARKLLAEECRLSWLLIIKCERTIYIQKKNKFFYSCPQARMCIIHAVWCVVLPRKFGGSVIRPLLARMAVALRADCMCVSCSEAHDLEHASYMSSSVIAR